MGARAWRRSGLVRRLRRFVPLASLLVAACGGDARGCGSEPSAGGAGGAWLSDGGALGDRVRAGELPDVRHLRFHSQALKRDIGVVVVTPADYARSDRAHPVLYLFSGLGSDEWTYLRDVGLEGPAMTSLRAHSSAPIVVMANSGDSGAYAEAGEALGPELTSFIDSHLRTRADAGAAGRSLEGFSLGGMVALTLQRRYPALFGGAAAMSSACFLIDTCAALRAPLREAARRGELGRTLLSVGEREDASIRAVNEELAKLADLPLHVISGRDHDLAAQLRTGVSGRTFGAISASFHLDGFERATEPSL